ncbi:MAG: Gfo/Idh/MocA family oxidoreductase [Polyangiales bacterium]
MVGKDDAVEAVRALTAGAGADAVVITASAPDNSPLELAGEIARDRAVVSVVGLLPLEIPRKTYYEKELSVVVSRSYGPGRYDPEYEERGRDYPIGYVRWTERRNLDAVLRAIETKRLDVASLITHRFAFDDVMSAYAVITGERPEPHLGVVLQYPASDKPAERPAPVAPSRAAGSSAPLGLAVVGTGGFATGVLLPALAEIDGAKLVATVSGRGLSAKHAADRFGAARVAESLDEALSLPEVDAAVIATRHASHAASAAKALRAGRDVFLEKPAAIDEAQLAALGEAVAASGARLQVGFNRRFAPFALEVADVFKHRRAGLVMTARVNAGLIPASSWIVDPEEGGGRIIGEGCHFIDLMASWAGADPTRVSAHAIGAEGGYQRADNVVVTVDFADGSVGTLIYTAMGDPGLGKERYEVFCEGTVAVIDDWRRLDVSHGGKTRTRRALKADKGHAEQLRRFVAACRSGAPSPTPWRTVEAVTRATFAAELSRKERVTVELTRATDAATQAAGDLRLAALNA